MLPESLNFIIVVLLGRNLVPIHPLHIANRVNEPRGRQTRFGYSTIGQVLGNLHGRFPVVHVVTVDSRARSVFSASTLARVTVIFDARSEPFPVKEKTTAICPANVGNIRVQWFHLPCQRPFRSIGRQLEGGRDDKKVKLPIDAFFVLEIQWVFRTFLCDFYVGV